MQSWRSEAVGVAWTCSSQPDLVSNSKAEGEELRLGQRSKGSSVIFIPKLRLSSKLLGSRSVAGGAEVPGLGIGVRLAVGCVCGRGGFASVCVGEKGVCVCVCVCCERGNAEEEETLLVLHANDRFGCNKSLDVRLGKMI